ncbi:MAG: DUF971 domain-containing protein [Chloroflexi bacterium]|nr:MAG: DUF971 domain-containing protein [Chloroflexota bacterium]
MTNIRPTGVKADRTERVITISWSDGTSCEYPFAGLRANCPCVECKGGHDKMGGPFDIELLHSAKNDELSITQVAPVGSYALQIAWSDGHDSGIFTWEYLYEGCK